MSTDLATLPEKGFTEVTPITTLPFSTEVSYRLPLHLVRPEPTRARDPGR